MGLLEKLLARLETVEAKLDAVLAGDTSVPSTAEAIAETQAAAAVETPKPPVTDATEKVESTAGHVVVATTDTELDAEGLPWDERINSGKASDNPHAKTSKGLWKKRKGVSPAVITEVQTELRNAMGAAPAVETVETPSAPTTPATPTAPTAPVAPGVPTAPSVPSTPAAPAVETGKEKALKAINHLTNAHKVPYANVISGLLTEHGVDTFENLPAELHDAVAVKAQGWSDFLDLCRDIVEKLDALDPEGAHGLVESVKTWCQQHGADIVAISQVPQEGVSKLHTDLEGHLKAWEKYFADVAAAQ